MTTDASAPRKKSWLDTELEDSFDEELELELDDETFLEQIPEIARLKHGSSIERRVYFRELFHLQTELIELQDWVAHIRGAGGSPCASPIRR